MGAGVGGGGADFVLRLKQIIDADEGSIKASAQTAERILKQSISEIDTRLAAVGGPRAAASDVSNITRQVQAEVAKLQAFISAGPTQSLRTSAAPAQGFRGLTGIKGEELKSIRAALPPKPPAGVFESINEGLTRYSSDIQSLANLSAKERISLIARGVANERLERAEEEAAALGELNVAEYAKQVALAKKRNAAIEAAVLGEQINNGFVAEEAKRIKNLAKLNGLVEQEVATKRVGVDLARKEIALAVQRTQKNRALRTSGALDVFQREQVSGARLKAAREARLASDDAYIAAQASVTLSMQLRKAKQQELVVADAAYREAIGIETANRLRAAAIKEQEVAAYKLTPKGAAVAEATIRAKGVTAAIKQVETEFQTVVQLQTQLGLQESLTAITDSEITAALQGVNIQQTINKLKAERAALEARIAPPAPPGPRIRTRAADATGGGGSTGGLGLAQGFKTTLRYGVASTVLFGLAAGASSAVKEATELDRIFNQVSRQFQSQFGPATEAATQQFAAFKREVFETAELTGQAADEVANVGFQLQGAFGGDTARAINETRDAIIAARVTGLDVKEVIDSFTALTKSFEDQDLSIQKVSDAALQLQEDLGVLAKETITFAADLAPIGAELGFSAEKLAAIGAVAQQTSGRSGTALAEAFGRVFPQIQGSAVEIIQIFRTLGPEISSVVEQAFANNDIDAVFDQLLNNYNRLSTASQGQLIDALGGRREAQSIVGVLKNGSKVFSEYGAALDAAGKTTEYFNDLQETLQQKLARLGEEFKRLVQVLFESGLKDFFVDFVDLLSTFVSLLESTIGLLSQVGSALGPISGPLTTALQAYLLLRGGQAIGRSLGPRFGFGGGGGAVGAGIGSSAVAQRAFPSLASRGGSHLATSASAGLLGGLRAGATKIGPGAFVVGGLIYSALSSNVKQAGEEAVAKLQGDLADARPTQRDAIYEAYFSGIGLGDENTDRATIERLLREGKSGKDIRKSLDTVVVGSQGGFEQGLDALGLSKKVARARGEGEAVIEQIVDDFVASFTEGVEKLPGNTDLSNAIRASVKDIFPELDKKITDQVVDELGTGRALGLTFNEFSNLEGLLDEDGTPKALEDLNNFQVNLANFINSLGEGGRGPRGTKKVPEITQEQIDAFIPNEALDDVVSARNRLLEAAAIGGDELGGVISQIATEVSVDNPDITEEEQAMIIEILDVVKAQLTAARSIAQDVGKAFQTLEQAIAGQELGTTSAAEVERIRAEAIEILQSSSNPEDLTKALKLQADARDVIFDRITGELDALELYGDLKGGSPTGQIVAKVKSVLADEGNGLSIGQEAELAQQAIESLREQQRVVAELIEDETARNEALAANIKAPEDVTAAILAQLISSQSNFTDALSKEFGGDQRRIDEVIRAIAQIAVEGQLSLAEAAKKVLTTNKYISDRLRDLDRRVAAAAKKLTATINDRTERDYLRLAGLANRARKDSGTGASVSDAFIDEINQIAKDELSFLDGIVSGSFAGSDPSAGSKVDTEDKEDEARKKARELAEARLDLLLAQVEGDPVKEAKIAQQQADIAFQFADGEAEKIRAQADRVRADRQLRDAFFDISQAEIGLLIAKANAAGDLVKAAKLSVKELERELYRSGAETGIGTAEFKNIEAQLIAARAGERDATLADRRQYFQYLADVGKITQGQLVGYLQSLLAIPELTKTQRQDIEREIYNLRQSLGQDFQYNLPSNLALPTAYEVRRLGQSGAAGQGYNDNRVISVEVNVASNASPEEIANAVSAAVGDPSRNGTLARRY